MSARTRCLAVALAISAACGGGGETGGPTALYELPTTVGTLPRVDRLPTPNELFAPTDADVATAIETFGFDSGADADATANLMAALAETPCAPLNAGVSFPIAIDVAAGETLEETTVDDESVVLLDLESGAALEATRIVRQLDGIVSIEPVRGTLLRESHRYAAYITTAVATADGRAITASPVFTRAQGGAAETDVEAAAASSLAPLAPHVDGLELAAATVFETCAIGADLERVREQITSGPAGAPRVDQIIAGAALDVLLGQPTSTAPGIDNPGGPTHANISNVILGRFDAGSYIAATPATQGRFERDADGAPRVKGTVELAFALALPAGPSFADTPVVVFMHGLGGDITELFAIADTLAAAGYASIAIDLPLHGSRFPGATDRVHNITGADGPDGIADSAGANAPLYFFGILTQADVTFLDPRVMRDHFRQGVADVFTLTHVLAEGDWSAIAGADPSLADFSIDADRLAFASESFGGFVGVPVLAFEPRLSGGILAVAGGGLTSELLENSAVYGPLFGPVLAGAYSIPTNRIDPGLAPPHTHLVYRLITGALAAAEPLSYAARARDRGVPITMSIANLDESVPNRSSEALAAALGLAWQPELGEIVGPQHVTDDRLPAAAPGATVSVVFTREPATHGMLTRQRGERRFERDGVYIVPRDPPQAIDNPTTELQNQMVDVIDVVTNAPAAGLR